MTRPLLPAIFAVVAFGAAANAQTPVQPVAEGWQGTRACNSFDLTGLRRLVRITEVPQGEETQRFNAAPYQYLYFTEAQTFIELAGSKNYTAAPELEADMKQQGANETAPDKLHQFVLGNEGALYFYVGGQPVASYFCRIHLANRPPLATAGDMLLQFDGGEDKANLTKLYRRTQFKN